MIETPCIKICQVNQKSGLCEGCKRTLEEISNWIYYSDEQRKKIIEELNKR